MPAGRIALLFGILLLAVALASAGRSGDRPAPPDTAGTTRRPPAPTVQAALPAIAPVRAGLGDVVRLQVRSPSPDRARIARLGLEWPVGPGLRGEIAFVADRPGRFRIGLRSGSRVGVLEVER